MAMRRDGYVVAREGKKVKIRADRQSACGGNCASCLGCGAEAVFLTCKDDPQNPYRIGEKVCLVMPFGRFFEGMLRTYGLLIASFLIGAGLGYGIGRSETSCVFGAFLGLTFGVGIMYTLNQRPEQRLRIERYPQPTEEEK